MRLAATRLGAISQGRGLGNLLWDLAGAVPSLDQRFAEDKSLVDAVSGQNLITFSRTSDATVTDSTGTLITVPSGTPRFDHNPVTGESLGLLVEEQRTNLALHSADVSQWQAINSPVIATNQVTALDGTVSADGVTATATNSNVTQQIPITSSANSYAISIFVQNNNSPSSRVDAYIRVGNTINTNGSVAINWSNLTATGVGGAVNARLEQRINNWYRLSFSLADNNAASDNLRVQFFPDITTGNKQIYLWGLQYELGAFPTSYIPTAGTAVTRTASLADLISSAIANNIRSFYVEFRSPAVGTRGVVSLNDNTANERASVITSGTDPRLVVHDGGVEQANVDGGTVTAGLRTRIAVRLSANSFAISINGSTVVTDNSGTLPTVDRLMFGRTQAGEYLNSTIARFTGWTQELPDSTLQALAQ